MVRASVEDVAGPVLTPASFNASAPEVGLLVSQRRETGVRYIAREASKPGPASAGGAGRGGLVGPGWRQPAAAAAVPVLVAGHCDDPDARPGARLSPRNVPANGTTSSQPSSMGTRTVLMRTRRRPNGTHSKSA